MKKHLAKILYNLLKNFIRFEWGKRAIMRTPWMKMYIFDTKIAEWSWSEHEQEIMLR